MKRKNITHFFGFLALTIGTMVFISMLPSAVTTGQSFEERRKAILERTKRQSTDLEAMRQQILKKNLDFQVGITEAVKHKIEEITGLVPPSRRQMRRERKRKEAEERRRKRQEKRKKREMEKKDDNDPEKRKFDKEQKKEKESDKVLAQCDPGAKAFNWRDAGYMTPVRNQSGCGSCWAFTAAASFEGAYKIKNGQGPDTSEQSMLECSGAGSCNGGWYAGVFDYMKRVSIPNERDNPYQAKQGICKVANATPYMTISSGYVSGMDIPRPSEIKKALCAHGPLASSLKVTPLLQAYTGGVFNERAPVRSSRDVNHGIVIAGWDDTKKAYLIKNSWSENWGEKGYAWVAYGTNNVGFGSMWVNAKPNAK